jgi:hypothetical protein
VRITVEGQGIESDLGQGLGDTAPALLVAEVAFMTRPSSMMSKTERRGESDP